MTPPDSTPKLPLWIFLVADAALLGAAVVIARESARPLSSTATLGIVGCVIVGTLAVLVPLIARYERQKNETLDDRQRALEALAITVSTSAEQISIAANGLHEIAEIAQKNLRHAEQLPHKLQEKIAEFQARLADASDTEKEELEKELVALRTSESERLETASTRIAKTAADLAKLEAATQQHLAAANEAIAKLASGTAAAIGQAQAAATQALAQARIEAARGLGEAGGTATRAIESAKNSALAEIETRLAAAGDALVARLARELNAKPAPLAPATDAPPVTPPPVPFAPTPDAGAAAESSGAPKPEATAHPPKRPRKSRREESDPAPAADAGPVNPATPAEAAPVPSTPPAPEAPAAIEPSPAGAEKPAEPTVSAPAPVEPAAAPALAVSPSGEISPPTPAPTAADTPAPAEPDAGKPPRKRAAKKTEEPSVPEEPALDLGIQDSPAAASSERMLTSDGATRVLVTAYIGIGNRLFIRGTGPGLSWEKGVPLQFVSIGKWRWETSDATAPVQFKLYKNDLVECTALGAQSLDPGYQQEVTAGF